jgi:hypothetical protein
MAIVVCTVLRAYDFQKLDQQLYTNTDEYEVWTCKIDINVCGTANDYATANDTTISPATVIQNSKRDGKTVTIMDCCMIKGGSFNLAATPTVDTLYGIGLPGASSISSNVITRPLTGEDLSTELKDATVLSTATDKIPATLQVTFRQTALAE